MLELSYNNPYARLNGWVQPPKFSQLITSLFHLMETIQKKAGSQIK